MQVDVFAFYQASCASTSQQITQRVLSESTVSKFFLIFLAFPTLLLRSVEVHGSDGSGRRSIISSAFPHAVAPIAHAVATIAHAVARRR